MWVISVAKIILFIYPFLRELILGKYSNDQKFKNIKSLFVIAALSSFAVNFVLFRSMYNLSLDKMQAKDKIVTLEKEINLLKEDKKQCLQELEKPKKQEDKVEEDKKCQVIKTKKINTKEKDFDTLHNKLKRLEESE